jgi:hypothetical protein
MFVELVVWPGFCVDAAALGYFFSIIQSIFVNRSVNIRFIGIRRLASRHAKTARDTHIQLYNLQNVVNSRYVAKCCSSQNVEV